MNNYLLFKSYSTSKLLPILYWIGFVAIFTAVPTLVDLYNNTMHGSGDWIEHEIEWVQKDYNAGYIDKIEYESRMMHINEQKEIYGHSDYDFLALVLIIILQIFWRVFCEWWGRWFSFLNLPESNSTDSNTENSTNKLKDFALLNAYIAVPYYAIVYFLLSIGCLIFLVYVYLNAPFTAKQFFETTVYAIVFLLFLRLYFEMSIVLFRYLKRK